MYKSKISDSVLLEQVTPQSQSETNQQYHPGHTRQTPVFHGLMLVEHHPLFKH